VSATRKRRLSEGAVVEASIVARVLGLPLLKLDATVALVPARVAPVTSPPRPVPSLRPGAPRRRLADAVRSIDEAAEILAEVRRDGS
jgi:hypothetical protein